MTADLLSGLRILVVEDEFLVLMLIEDMLADLGGTALFTAPSVRKALALVEAQPFDVAMLDMNLGGEKSYPVADVLAGRGVPFLFATGYGDTCLPGAHRDRSVLKKPFRAHELCTAMTGLLAQSVQRSRIHRP